MGTIRVEAVPVQSYFLGLFGFDHLQLVYQDEDNPIDSQDYWFVIEGIQDGPIASATLGASGESGVLSLGVANGASRDELIEKIGTPETRGSRIVYTGPNAWSTWQSMANYAGEIDDAQLPYIPASFPVSSRPTINSTSLASSVLWSAGIDLNNLMPFKMRLSPGPGTILGTPDGNDITIGGNYTSLATGPGNDSLHGSANTVWAEKFHAGLGDDTIYWSYGTNIMHGGQDDIHYILDGSDLIDYTGVGLATIVANEYAIDHKTPAYLTIFAGGLDHLYSIEQVKWSRSSDIVVAGKGVLLIEKPLAFDMSEHTGARGDELGMSDGNTPLLVNFVTDQMISVQAEANEGLDAGYWVKSAEWFTGSAVDDRIYAGATLNGIDGGEGDDLIDGRFVAAFSGLSPQGYDIEIYGGGGDDTIVSGGGWSYAQGGAGADLFVLSTMSDSEGNVEFVIDDADTNDKLYVPFDFFTPARGSFDGSQLFQLSGGVFKLDDITQTSFFFWGPVDDDQFSGNIDFAGSVQYTMDGSDLLITVFQGQVITETIDNGPNEPPGPTIRFVRNDDETATTIRVTNWTEGKLGLTFPVTYNSATGSQGNVLSDYPGFMSAVDAATSADKFISPLAGRPDSHLPKELIESSAVAARTIAPPATDGTSGDDTIVASFGGPYQITGGAGDDDITASDGGDYIDGGSGDDIMRGGRGNDVYVVDSVSDQVIELDRGGFDTVESFIDYQLGAFVEHVTLNGAAVSATGNALRNTLIGNSGNNILTSGGGDDKLAGNAGDDSLIGGDGGDAYIWELGDGHDTIEETGASGKDVIVLAGDLTPGDVTLIRDPSHPLDLTLRFPDGGSLTIKDYFAAAEPNIDGVEFMSGSSWTAAELSALAASAIVTSNTAPVAADDIYAFAGGLSVTIPVAALLDNDHDSDGNTLLVTELSNIQGGSAVLDGNGGIVITRAGSAEGHVSFSYTISDGNGGFSQASFDLSMLNNAAPVITTSSLLPISEDTVATGTLAATDADGDTLIYRVKDGQGPAKGSITLNGDGTFTYTPNANANGTDGFTLTVTDGFSAPSEQRFDFAITSINDIPTGITLSNTAVQEFSVNGTSVGQLSAADPDAPDTHTYTLLNSAGGRFAITGNQLTVANGLLLDFERTASHSVSIKVTDSAGATFTQDLTISVSDVNPEVVTGDGSANIFVGGAGADTFVGMGGNDTLNGGAGIDTMTGGAGDDIMLVSDAGDIVNEAAGEGTNDYVFTTASFALGTGQEIEGLTAYESPNAVDLTGNEFRQVIRGNSNGNTLLAGAGNDSLYGFGGNDTLESQQGNDHLFGGAGNDNFQFRQSQLGAQSGIDRIYDFSSGDVIKFDVTAVTSPTALAAADFVTGTAALDASDLMIYDQTSGALWFDADGSGSAAKILFAVLDTKPVLTASDFLLF